MLKKVLSLHNAAGKKSPFEHQPNCLSYFGIKVLKQQVILMTFTRFSFFNRKRFGMPSARFSEIVTQTKNIF